MLFDSLITYSAIVGALPRPAPEGGVAISLRFLHFYGLGVPMSVSPYVPALRLFAGAASKDVYHCRRRSSPGSSFSVITGYERP